MSNTPNLSTLDDDDLFDALNAAVNAGVASVPNKISTTEDRDLLAGLLRAAERNPAPEQALMHDLTSRCTIDEKNGKVTLPDDAPPDLPPRFVERVRLIALLGERS